MVLPRGAKERPRPNSGRRAPLLPVAAFRRRQAFARARDHRWASSSLREAHCSGDRCPCRCARGRPEVALSRDSARQSSLRVASAAAGEGLRRILRQSEDRTPGAVLRARLGDPPSFALRPPQRQPSQGFIPTTVRMSSMVGGVCISNLGLRRVSRGGTNLNCNAFYFAYVGRGIGQKICTERRALIQISLTWRL